MTEVLDIQTKEPVYIALEGAEGKIQRTEIQDTEIVDALTEDISIGAFNYSVAGLIPCKCIDGRTCQNATEGPNAAGGTESLFVADDLTTKRFATEDGSVTGGMHRLIESLRGKGLEIGGHGDDSTAKPEDASGCGANDKLPFIYDMITRKHDVIKKYVEAILGEPVFDETEQMIIDNARVRVDFSSGKDVLNVLGSAENAHIEQLEGAHKEVVAAINLRANTTLSRQLLKEKYGEDYQAFNVDAWSFRRAAEAMAESEDEIRQKVIAMTYYNVATALVLCGPQMRVVVVR